MWKCPNCNRIFQKNEQPHSCKKVPLADHFRNKELAKGIFDILVKTVNKEVGKAEVISLPCCIHLFGNYDFMAALPKADRLEIRFALGKALKSPRLKQSAPISQHSYENCVDITSGEDIDKELIGWLKESYHLR